MPSRFIAEMKLDEVQREGGPAREAEGLLREAAAERARAARTARYIPLNSPA